MLDDRAYMRRDESRSHWPVTNVVLVVNAVVFVVASILEFYRIFPVTHVLGLSLEGVKHGYLWQFLTFQFLHAGPMHLFCNSLAIYFFGRAVEETLGRGGFLKLYLASGVIGGALQMAGAWLLPTHFGGVVSFGAVVGASAGAFGLVAAFAAMHPERQLTLLLFFIIPFSMRARTLIWVSACIALFGIIVPNDNIAHAAHLGGILTGLVYIRWIVQSERTSASWQPFRREPRSRELVGARSRGAVSLRRPKTAVDALPEGDFISREVDPILDKISAHGIQSLTERERKVLEAARAKMARR